LPIICAEKTLYCWALKSAAPCGTPTASDFRATRPATDLGQWQIFENENPDTFAGMYQFWIQKPA